MTEKELKAMRTIVERLAMRLVERAEDQAHKQRFLGERTTDRTGVSHDTSRAERMEAEANELRELCRVMKGES